jgi:PST family polysaccharide transporter
MSEVEKMVPEINNQTSSYRSIFKATSLFGGVQVYQILIGIIKQKFVAILLGTSGMGIQGLYQSAILMVQSFTSMGLAQSAVRDVSEAHGAGDTLRIGKTVAIVRRLVWITGLLGMAATIVFSPVLSKTSFGDYSYIIPFVILSIILLLDQICVGQKVVLQGMRRLNYLAKASAIGVTVGLLVSVPLYYFMGKNGIVPALIATSLTALLLSWYYSRKVEIEKVKVTTREAIRGGGSMLKLGIAMSINAILGTCLAFALQAFIRYMGSVEQVGLYAAGFAIMNTYVGMVFNAMSTDYYPRLSAVNNDNERCKAIINQQGEIAVLILAPIIISCIILMPFLIRLIYSEEFLPANDYISWAILGLMFKAASFAISYVFLAKAESKAFIINETITKIYMISLEILGYYLFGLAGLGVAFLLTYFIYSIQVYIIAKRMYEFGFTYTFKKVFTILFVIVLTCFVLVHALSTQWVYFPLVVLFLLCVFFSLNELNKRINLLEIVNRKRNNI